MERYRATSVGLIVLIVLFCGAATAQQVKKTDWCEITVPERAAVGETIQVRIKLTEIEGEVYLFCDLKDQGHKMMKWGGKPNQPGRLPTQMRVFVCE